MPTFRHGKSTRLLIGAYELSSQFRDYDFTNTMDQAEQTTFLSSFKSFANGMGDATLNLTGMYAQGATSGNVVPDGYVTITGSGLLTTPDTAGLSITGDIDIRVAHTTSDWTPPVTAVVIAGKWNAVPQTSYLLYISSGAALPTFSWSSTGSNQFNASATAVLPFTDGQFGLWRCTLDVDNGASGSTATFYTKASSPSTAFYDAVDDTGWVQLGNAVVQAGVTSIFDGTTAATLGGFLATSDPLAGNLYAAVIKSGINGTIRAAVDCTRATALPIVENGNSWSAVGSSAILTAAEPPNNDPVLASAFGQSTPLEATVAIEGTFTPPARVATMDANLLHYELKSGVGSIVEVVANLNATGGAETAYSLADLVSGVGFLYQPAVDTGIATSNGGFLIYHLTAITSGNDTVPSVVLQSSTTSSGTFVTHVSQPIPNGVCSGRVLVAAGTTINRWLHVGIGGTGTVPTVTFTASFVRF